MWLCQEDTHGSVAWKESEPALFIQAVFPHVHCHGVNFNKKEFTPLSWSEVSRECNPFLRVLQTCSVHRDRGLAECLILPTVAVSASMTMKSGIQSPSP